jgi:two-component system cell cycle sensor histidine kinase/response regulator CckA
MPAMVKKPPYEELGEKIRKLENKTARHREPDLNPITVSPSGEAFFEAMPLPVFLMDIKGRCLGCNAAFAEFTGIASDEIKGKTAAELWPDQLAKVDFERDLELIRDQQYVVYELFVRDKTAENRPVILRESIWRDENGTAVGLFGALVDAPDPAPVSDSIAEHQKFQLMTDFTHGWEYWIGTDGELRHVSPSCKDYTGVSQTEFMENPGLLLDIVHPDDVEKMAMHIQDDHTSGSLKSIEFRIIDRSGNVRWLSHKCQPVYDENHTFLGRRASNWEITDQRLAEKQRDQLTDSLKKTTTLLNTVLDAIPDVIGVQDRSHRIIRYNKAGYDFLNMTPSQVRGKKCHHLIGHAKPCAVCATAEVYKTKLNARVEKYVEELDRWLDVRAYPVIDEQGKIAYVIEHLRDISKEKKAAIKLKEAHERLITVLDSIDAHIYVADMNTYEILFMNQKMVEDFKADLVGKRCYEAFRDCLQPCDHCTNKKLLDSHQKPAGVHTWQSRNPITNRWYINFDRAIKWVDDRIVKIQIATDISDAKRNEDARIKMEHQLLQAQKYEAIGTLAGGIAHDFNNLLMGIQGRISLMSTELDHSQAGAEHIGAIESYIRSATELTMQLLGYARGGKYEVTPTDLNGLVGATATMFGRTKKEIQIHTKFHDPSPVVNVDRGQIEQVLLNLFVNAWQAMPNGGALYLETRITPLDDAFCAAYQVQPGRYARISVADTGIGMTAAVRQRVFDPFFTTKEMGRGTGLGLASAYGIIKNHQGIITIDSEVGHGTTVDFYVPLSAQKPTSESPVKDRLIRGSETILLVDDEAMILEVGKALLEKLGYGVVVANGGQEAFDAAKQNDGAIDLVILDLVMPGMDGGHVFDGIRRIHPQMPVILSSGYAIDGQAEEIMKRGCNGFIQKPFNISELSRKIRAVLDGPKDNPTE